MDTVAAPTGWLLELLVLDVDTPTAPADAVEMEPVYVRDPPSAPDPVVLHSIEWIDPTGRRTITPADSATDQ